jgi:osmoprotectant transport system permease protein
VSDNLRERLHELPVNLASHLELSVLALLVGVVLSVPIAILLTRHERLRYPVLTVVGLVQTIPSLALLALLVPVLAYSRGLGLGIPAFGFAPALVALTLYSMLPVLRNTVAAILGVERPLIEAARGLGMTDWQCLWQVELPLAAPVILAGIRTAAVWVVGSATLATPVGQRCLGNYIFAGLQTRNWLMIVFGVVAAAALAVLMDLLLAGAERAAVARRRGALWLSLGALATVLAVALAAPALARRWSAGPVEPASARPAGIDRNVPAAVGAGAGRPIRIGAKSFTEQYILAALLGERVRAHGRSATTVDSLGSAVIFDALRGGEIDLYVDYTGTLWAHHMRRGDVPPRWQIAAEVTGWLAGEQRIRNLGQLGFANAYALLMRRERAAALGITSIAELAPRAAGMRIGGDYEFFSRPEWSAVRAAYRLRFAEQRSMDPALMYEALAGGAVDVIAGYTTDGRIAAHDLVTLTDPRQSIPPYDAVLLLGPRIAGDEALVAALLPLVGALSVDDMRQANWMVDRPTDKRTPQQAARWLLERLGR